MYYFSTFIAYALSTRNWVMGRNVIIRIGTLFVFKKPVYTQKDKNIAL